MKTLTLGLLTSPLAALPRDAGKVLQAVLPQEPCAEAFLGLKAGERYQVRFFEAEDLEDHWFALLRQGHRYLLLELLLPQEPKAAPRIVERRAWTWRNGQRRLQTEADGFAACETRLGVPLERFEKVWNQGQERGRWSQERWPAAPKETKKQFKNKAKS
jgi:hypothetical protein